MFNFEIHHCLPFKQNTGQLFIRPVGFVLQQYWLYLLLALNYLCWKILHFSAQKYFHSINNPSIYSKHVHVEYVQETELLGICQKAMQNSWKVKVIYFRYSLHWALLFHDINPVDRLNPSKNFNNMHYAASDK